MSAPKNPGDLSRSIEEAQVIHFPQSSGQPPPDAPAVTGGQGSPPSPPGGGEPGSSASGPEGEGPSFEIDKMNREWAFVLHGSRGLIVREREDVEPEDRVRFISLDAFKAYFSNQTIRWKYRAVEDGEEVEKTAVRKRGLFWLYHSDRRTYDGVCFFPNPDGAKAPRGYFNLWRGFGLAPATDARAVRERKYAIFRDHLETNICNSNRDHARWIWHWFAHMLQRPRERIGTAIVLRGKMGAGKTVLGEVIGALAPSHYFLVDDARYLTGQFNAHMASCLLLQVDEGFWAGDKSAEGRLKGLITARKQMVEAKGVDPVRLDNYVRVLFSSNEGWVVPAGLEERRFAVFDVADHVMQDKAYFAALFAELKDGGYAALLADLLATDLDAEDAPDLRRIPKTGALLEQKVRSLDVVPAWWFGRLQDGTLTRRASQWDRDIPVVTLYNDMLNSSDRIGVRRKPTETEFGIQMHRLLPWVEKKRRYHSFQVRGDDGQFETINRRVWAYTMPPLEECRQHVRALFGQEIEWQQVDEDENGADSPTPDEDGGF